VCAVNPQPHPKASEQPREKESIKQPEGVPDHEPVQLQFAPAPRVIVPVLVQCREMLETSSVHVAESVFGQLLQSVGQIPPPEPEPLEPEPEPIDAEPDELEKEPDDDDDPLQQQGVPSASVTMTPPLPIVTPLGPI
jgi:hypothetical protein